ncbi:permease [Cohnella sp. 56]|uniref:permease n=1 Tax=Cohnella sp. 56 TaxID=3113722 RepID=UPI0030E878B0
MSSLVYRWTLNSATIGCLILLYLIFTGQGIGSLARITHVDRSQWQAIKTIFVSIFLEALPFMLLGVLVSALLNLFVSEAALTRWLPRNPVLGVLCACLLGILLPVCECGMIPIVRRLLRKGMPVYIGIAYILAAPIVNPVTYFATYAAFRTMTDMALYRTLMGFAVAVAVGITLYLFQRANPIRTSAPGPATGVVPSGHQPHHTHTHAHTHSHDASGGSSRLLSLATHDADEFFEMGKFLMLGALLTALIQTFVSRGELLELSGGVLGSHLLMMGFAYLISLCSTSDAFVAASFTGLFPKGALLAFLVYGPMIDFKNTLMLLSVFKSRFVVRLIVLVTLFVLVFSWLAGYWTSRHG